MEGKWFYVLSERVLYFSRWFDKGIAVESVRLLTPPFERYDPEKHGPLKVAPVDLDSWVDMVR